MSQVICIGQPVAWMVRWLPSHNEPRGLYPWVLLDLESYRPNPGREEVPLYRKETT
jgi:hypothetical protein